MDIYKLNDRGKRFGSADYLGYNGKQGQMRYGSTNLPPVGKYRFNSSLSRSNSNVMTATGPLRIYDDYQDCFAMESDIPTALHSINESKMSAIARQALQRENLRLPGWRARQRGGGIGNLASLGLYRS